ncbi:MAG TPA: hypothetical protein VN282_26860 [Pyrinomonadaceae bacterium]|nr:hypothetical protein [Pyrinomonadaceae bacterium]
MKAIAILPEGDDAHPTTFRAVTTDRKAAGRTPGEALDALTSQLGAEKASSAVVVQLFRPDSHFTAEQSERLAALMERWRTARDAGSALSPAEQAELEKLVEEEIQGSAERSAQMSRALETTQPPRHPRSDEKATELIALRELERLYDVRAHSTIWLAGIFGMLLGCSITYYSTLRRGPLDSLLAIHIPIFGLAINVVDFALVVSLVSTAISLLAIQRSGAAYKRAINYLYAQVEGSRRPAELEASDRPPEQSASGAEQRGQVGAR